MLTLTAFITAFSGFFFQPKKTLPFFCQPSISNSISSRLIYQLNICCAPRLSEVDSSSFECKQTNCYWWQQNTILHILLIYYTLCGWIFLVNYMHLVVFIIDHRNVQNNCILPAIMALNKYLTFSLLHTTFWTKNDTCSHSAFANII